MGERDTRPSEDHIRRTQETVKFLLPALREVARRNGYALATHGTLERDIDIIAAPWRDGAATPEELARALYAACEAIVGWCCGPSGWTEKESPSPPPIASLPNPDRKPHGRLGWIIQLGGPYIDLSVMPPLPKQETETAK